MLGRESKDVDFNRLFEEAEYDSLIEIVRRKS
jgi:hypothetical protein